MKPPALTAKQRKRNTYNFIENKWDLDLYKSLMGAKQRCTNKKNYSFNRYGGRGIRWQLGSSMKKVFFQQKKAYYEAKRKYPNETISINRIDVDGHYENGNIEWITVSENSKQSLKDTDYRWQRTGAKVNEKRVKCITTGAMYSGTREASREIRKDGVMVGTAPSNISRCCNGEQRFAGKLKDETPLVWKYI